MSLLNIKVHNSLIRKRLNKFSMFVKVASRKPLLSEKNREARLMQNTQKLHLNKPHDLEDF